MLPFTALLLLLALVLVAIGLAQHWVEKWPLSTALLYLVIGGGAGALAGPPLDIAREGGSVWLLTLTETVVLISLFTVGVRLRRLPWAAWRLAVVLAGTGMLVTIALAGFAAFWLLALPWTGALVLATLLAPTDPVLASEVQVRSAEDRDAVRLTLTAEGGLNDGTALPVMLLALGLLGSHPLGPWGMRWLTLDLVWSIGGGLVIGWALGRGLDRLLRRLLAAGHTLAWDELLYAGCIALAYGLARLSATSAFIVVFVTGVALFWTGPRPMAAPLASPDETGLPDPAAAAVPTEPLDERLAGFGARCERLLEVFMVLALGAVLVAGGLPSAPTLAFALLFVLVLRPLAVFAVVRRPALPSSQRRLIAWFGVRGVGSLFYLVFALHHGLPQDLQAPIVSACLWTLAVSIVLHGISATPLMNWYQQRGAREPPARP